MLILVILETSVHPEEIQYKYDGIYPQETCPNAGEQMLNVLLQTSITKIAARDH